MLGSMDPFCSKTSEAHFLFFNGNVKEGFFDLGQLFSALNEKVHLLPYAATTNSM